MTTILIEGDPGAIRGLYDELACRNYLTSDFVTGIVEINAFAAPDLLAACKAVAIRPAEAVEIMRREGLAIDNQDDPMQKLAFTFYTMLVGSASEADAAIAKAEGET